MKWKFHFIAFILKEFLIACLFFPCRKFYGTLHCCAKKTLNKAFFHGKKYRFCFRFQKTFGNLNVWQDFCKTLFHFRNHFLFITDVEASKGIHWNCFENFCAHFVLLSFWVKLVIELFVYCEKWQKVKWSNLKFLFFILFQTQTEIQKTNRKPQQNIYYQNEL